MFYFMDVVHSFMNYALFRKLCDRMRFEVDCAKSRNTRRPASRTSSAKIKGLFEATTILHDEIHASV